MTVAFDPTPVVANGNDVATVFSFSPLVIFEADDLLVTHVASGGTETVIPRGVDSTSYSVSVTAYPGTGSITYPASGGTPLATGASIRIELNVDYDQDTGLNNHGPYFSKTLETALDKLTVLTKQLKEIANRSLKVPVADEDTYTTEITGLSAGGYLKVNGAGTAIISSTLASTDATASDDNPADISLSAADPGVGTEFSRDDHVHLLPTVSVAKGGTGATTAPGARTNLGLVIGTDVAAQSAAASAIVFVIDGGGATITTGIKGELYIPFACTITANTALADQTGSIVVDIWKDTLANYPPDNADSITASAPVTITTDDNSQDATLTGWTTSVAAGDTLIFNVDSVTTIQRVAIVLNITKV